MKTTFRLLTITSALAFAALGLTACSATSANVAGTWGTPDTPEQPSLVFEDDGSYHGNDGCNNVMGSWTEEGGTIDLGQMASTMRFCEGVETWLSNGVTAKISGTTLTVFGPADAELGTLERNDS